VNLESWLLAGGAVVALGLLAVALWLVRSDRPLRARLGLVFVTLALSPSLLTLVVLWRELAPRTRLSATQGVERSMSSALTLARETLAARRAEAQVLAERGAERAATQASVAALATLTAAPHLAVLFDVQPRRVLAVHGGWTPHAAATFLTRPEIDWPAGPRPSELSTAPDSSAVVAGAARVPGTQPARCVLVALRLEPAQAAAIRAVVQGVQQSQRLGFLEDLKLRTAARLMAAIAIAYGLLAVLLAVLLARSVTRPIERLRQAFEAVAAGALGHQVAIGGTRDGELGRLLRGFNSMSRELQESKSQLVRQARLAAWQDVARRLAHEIKNPLTPITLSIHRLRRRGAAEDAVVRECLDTILEETSHLERLANEFSSFARLPKPKLEATDPAPVLQQVLDLYAAHPNVQIAARLDGMPAVWADRDQIRQVFTNLAKNGVEAMPGGGELAVEWQRTDGNLQLTFLDAGSGFEPAALEHLFDPAFTTKPSGSGLGLAIVRRILEDHGGHIEVGNRESRGAWVRVTLRTA
jgi:nitrogen fixation/metabolism regulation signal transduction histidine kinase